MINPIRLVNDLFADEKLSDANLRAFTEDHLIRVAITENNPAGVYDLLITQTETRYTSYFGKITNEATIKAISEGLTINMNNARAATEAKISQLQGLVKFKFGEGTDIYQQFYPQGMDEYYQAKIGDILPLFIRFKNVAEANLTADYPAEVSTYNSLLTEFTKARDKQETAFGQIDALGTGRHEDRKALTLQLTTNFLTIALNNLGKPDRFDDYYDPRYLPIESDNGIREDKVAASGMDHIPTSALTIKPDTKIKLLNPGTTVLQYYFGPSANSQPDDTIIDIAPGASSVKLASDLGFTALNTFLNVKNTGAAEGKYRVEIG